MTSMSRRAIAHELLNSGRFQAELAVVAKKAGKRLRNPECVSRELFTNALALAANRGLLQSDAADLAHRRRAFAEETAAAVSEIAAIGELDYRLRHSSRDLH